MIYYNFEKLNKLNNLHWCFFCGARASGKTHYLKKMIIKDIKEKLKPNYKEGFILWNITLIHNI